MVDKTLENAPQPRELGYTLCAMMLQRAYEEAWRLDSGYGTRKTLYNLYHVLNHYNLFGGGYSSQAEGMVHRLLAELRG